MTAADRAESDRVARNLQLIKQVDDALNRRDLDVFAELHHPEVLVHESERAQPTHGRAALRQGVGAMLKAFPDLHVHNDPYPIQFGQEDWVTVIGKMTGSFGGELVGSDGDTIAPTGKAFEVKFATIARWEDELVVEEWVLSDHALLMEQIGAAA